MTRRRGVGKAGTDRNQKTRAEPNLPSVARLCVKTICGEIRELATALAPRLETIGLYCADACFMFTPRLPTQKTGHCRKMTFEAHAVWRCSLCAVVSECYRLAPPSE
jgi:hypothetical protein